MNIDEPSGTLEITDDALIFRPADGGNEINVSLNPLPDYTLERGIYGEGALSIGGKVIPVRNEDLSTIAEELQRPRAGARSSRRVSSSDKATTGEANA